MRSSLRPLFVAAFSALVGCGALLGADFDRGGALGDDAGVASDGQLGTPADGAFPDGTVVLADGAVVLPDGAVVPTDGAIGQPDGQALAPRIVLFGGSDGAQPLSDTWEYDGTSWNKRAGLASSPPARQAHAMATLAGKVVLFGGYDVNKARLGDTWEYDGATWTQRAVTGPPARSSHAMTTVGNNVVLFGGVDVNNARLGDTWVWDGAVWTKKSDAGPSPRNAVAMTTLEGKAVLVGGTDGSDHNDTWLWDGATWTQSQAAAGPPIAHAAAMATLGSHAYHFGGAQLVAETWVWDGTGWARGPIDGPDLRLGHTMTALGGQIVFFGGTDGQAEADTWTLDGTAWTLSKVVGPSRRQSHAAVTFP